MQFCQLETATGKLLSVVKGAGRNYSQNDSYLATKHINGALNHEETVHANETIKITSVPHGEVVVLQRFNGKWIASCQGVAVSNDWFKFIRAQLDRYGVMLSDLTETTVYTFLCTDDSIYLV